MLTATAVSAAVGSSEHATVAEAFGEIDRLSAQMVRTGAPSHGVEFIVVDAVGRTTRHELIHSPAGEAKVGPGR